MRTYQYDKINVLVTGGLGFIGSNLCKHLTDTGDYNVTVIDNLSSGRIENKVHGVRYNIADTSEVFSQRITCPDIVFHLGEYARVERSFEDIQTVLKSNILGTQKVIEYSVENKSKLIYAGSSTKFGDGGLARDSSPYAWSKASNTELVSNYGRWFELNHAITYFYNAYGPLELESGPYATLVGIYKRAMRTSSPLSVVSPGTQIRNFTHVDDICRGLLLIAQHGSGDGYGLGHSLEYSVLDVAQMFGEKIEWLPPRRGNRMSAHLQTEKSTKLGWQPSIALHEYIDTLRAQSWND